MTDATGENSAEPTRPTSVAQHQQARAELRRNNTAAYEASRRTAVTDAVANTIHRLSRQQRHFVIEYLVHGNATRAAEAAGYSYPGKQGSRLLRTKKVQAAIDEYFYEQEMPARRAVAIMSSKAGFDPSRYLRFTYDGIRLLDAWVDVEAMRDDGFGHMIKAIKYTKDGRMVVEFDDSLKALEDIMRYHGLFTDRVVDDRGVSQAEHRAEHIEALRQQARAELADWSPEDEEE